VAAEVNFLELNVDLVRGILMVALIIAFLGMWAWAWSGKRKRVFHDASMLPLEEDDGRIPGDPLQDGKDRQERIEE